MTIKAAIEEYLLDIEVKKYSPRTLRSYKNNLNTFLNFCEKEGVSNTSELSLSTVKAYANFMGKSKLKGTYINSLLKTLKSFITYCNQEEYCSYNPKRHFFWVQQDKPLVRTFEANDVKKMLSHCSGNGFLDVRDKAILTLLFETGIRCLELCELKEDDVHEDFIVINGKFRKQRVAPVTPILAKALSKYLAVKKQRFPFPKGDWLFVSFRDNQLTNGAVEHIIRTHGEHIEDIRVSPHTCRHFFAQQQLKMGTDVYTISRLLGHEKLATTQIYLNSLRDKDVIETAKKNSVLQSL